MAETLRERMVRGYAWSIYIDGIRKFETTSADFHTDIQTYAATHFKEKDITNAFTKGWITEDNYNKTIAIQEALNAPEEVPPTEETPPTGEEPPTEVTE